MAVREPWDGFLRLAMPSVAFIIFANTTVVFTLAIITVSTMHFYQDHDDETVVDQLYLDATRMRIRADLIFFYITIPAVMLIETGASNYCLWTDKLRPKYAITSSILAICIWVLQIILWSICLSCDGENFCPAIFKTSTTGIYAVQHIGTDNMVVWATITLFVLYPVSLAFGVIGRSREKKQQQTHEEECGKRRWHASGFRRSSGRSSDEETKVGSRCSMEEALEVPFERLQVGQMAKPRRSDDQSMNRLTAEKERLET